MGLISCSDYFKEYLLATEILNITIVVLYSIFLIFNLNRIRIVHSCQYISNRRLVVQSYICILLIIVCRLLSSTSFVIHKNYELDNVTNLDMDLDQQKGLLWIMYVLFNILTIPLLLFLVSMTTYQWYLVLMKNQFHQYLN